MIILTTGMLLGAGPSPAAAAGAPATSTASTTQTVTVVGKVKSDPVRDWYDLAPVVAGIGGLLTLVVISLQLLASGSATRQQRASEAAAVWNDRVFNEIFSPVWAFVSVGGPEDCVRKAKAWFRASHGEERSLPGRSAVAGRPQPPRACVNDVQYVLGILEEFALRYNENELPRRWVALTLGPNLVRVLRESLWLIRLIRVQEEWPTMSCELVAAVQDLRRHDWPHLPGRLEDPRPIRNLAWWDLPHPIYQAMKKEPDEPRIRVFCLPPEPAKASDRDWLIAIRLSILLDEEAARNALGETEPIGPAREPAWKAIVVPKSIMFTWYDVAMDEQLSEKLNGVLSSCSTSEVEKQIGDLEAVLRAVKASAHH